MNPQNPRSPQPGTAMGGLATGFAGEAAAQALPLHPLGTARQRLDPQPTLAPEVLRALSEADAGPETAFLIWQVAAWASDLGAGDRARFEALVAALLIAVGQGSTRLRVGAGDRALLGRVAHLVGAPGERKPLVLDGEHLHLHRHFAAEQRLVAAIQARRPQPGSSWHPPAAIAAAVTQAAAEVRPSLTPEQRQVLAVVLGRSLGVISGGPGTGKTTIVLALVRALGKLGIPASEIALAAPTGKAAGRLDEASESAGLAGGAAGVSGVVALAPAQTLHRLLGYSPSAQAFAHHEQSPLPHRVVIVDEASMIDLFLMDALFRALAPETALVLIGDADQLPSVDAGAVFRDLADDLAKLGVRLTQSHRLDPARPQARRILELAASVRAGRPGPGVPGPGLTELPVAQLTFAGPELVSAGERESFLERWYSELVAPAPDDRGQGARFEVGAAGFSTADQGRLEALFAHHQRCRLLAVTRGRPTGAEALNAWMHARAGGSGARPIAGEPVMVLRNDYQRGLWNGDQGVVIDLCEPHRTARAAAAFKVRGRWTAYTLESLRDGLSLAFALTVHKAQGSEYDHVALVLPDVPMPLLSRELVYTALTRSRQSVTVCGAQAVLDAALSESGARSSGIAEKLKG